MNNVILSAIGIWLRVSLTVLKRACSFAYLNRGSAPPGICSVAFFICLRKHSIPCRLEISVCLWGFFNVFCFHQGTTLPVNVCEDVSEAHKKQKL